MSRTDSKVEIMLSEIQPSDSVCRSGDEEKLHHNILNMQKNLRRLDILIACQTVVLVIVLVVFAIITVKIGGQDNLKSSDTKPSQLFMKDNQNDSLISPINELHVKDAEEIHSKINRNYNVLQLILEVLLQRSNTTATESLGLTTRFQKIEELLTQQKMETEKQFLNVRQQLAISTADVFHSNVKKTSDTLLLIQKQQQNSTDLFLRHSNKTGADRRGIMKHISEVKEKILSNTSSINEKLLLMQKQQVNLTEAVVLQNNDTKFEMHRIKNLLMNLKDEKINTRLQLEICYRRAIKLQDQTIRREEYAERQIAQCYYKNNITRIIDALSTAAREIYLSDESLYKYKYDDRSGKSITDGGGDMYDDGNKLTVETDISSRQNLQYNTSFSDNNTYIGLTKTSHPFTLSMVVRNTDGLSHEIRLMEHGNLGADGSGSWSTFEGSVSVPQISAYYTVYQVYGASNDPSIVQIYFYMYSAELFNSTGSRTLTLEVGVRNTKLTNNTAMLRGTMNNVYFNYMLLSRSPPTYMSSTEVKTFLEKVLLSFKNTFWKISSGLFPN